MKRFLGTTIACLTLSLAVSGCVQLETQQPPVSQGPATQPPTPAATPTESAPAVEPDSAKGLQERIAKLSKGAASREIQDGRHPFDNAVPGTERTVLANVASGEHIVALPEKVGGDTLLVAIQCLPGSSADGPIHTIFTGPDSAGESGSGSVPTCHAGSYFAFSSGFNPDSQPTRLNISAPAGTKYEYSVVTFTAAPGPSEKG
ncbi:hypothetical protein [Paeniglutamicibacter kerguelensis]|uniref:Secreted protein n=1 Tax=Paeniglutamicibacter kerguelensis TaxID=254788 RepID=A0ABS4XF47_9MICC|nr:hypothetical protein [Paeniglutamicibacter kerguelensis]MBP2387079.1 hypothetical protein [Paeniglutamicibacter kerguelensis]